MKAGRTGKFTLPGVCICVFLILFLAGVLLANRKLSDEALWIGFLNENDLLRFAGQSGGIRDFLSFALRSRVVPWMILVVCGCFSWGAAVCAVWSGWLGVSGGFLSAALIRRHGAAGILYMGGICLPQVLLYAVSGVALLYLIRFFQREKKRAAGARGGKTSARQAGVYVLFSILFSGIYFAGILAEYYVNPFLLRQLR